MDTEFMFQIILTRSHLIAVNSPAGTSTAQMRDRNIVFGRNLKCTSVVSLIVAHLSMAGSFCKGIKTECFSHRQKTSSTEEIQHKCLPQGDQESTEASNYFLDILAQSASHVNVGGYIHY